MKTTRQFITLSVFVLLLALCVGTISCRENNTETPKTSEKTSVVLDKTTLELFVGDRVAVTFSLSDESVPKLDFIWTTDKPDIITIEEMQNSSVNITALKEGTVELKIVADSDPSTFASCQIKVSPKGSGGENNTVHILGIGNSFTDDALQDYLYNLAIAGGKKIVIARLTIGGATLADHLGNTRNNRRYSYWKIEENGNTLNGSKSIADGVSDEAWDYISFQQQSENAYRFDTYKNTLPELIQYVKSKSSNPNTNYAVLQCWAYANNYPTGWTDFNDYFGRDQLKMHAALVDVSNRASALIEPRMKVLPAGTAIQNGRTSVIGDKFCRDGYHLDVNVGRFTVACTWYEAIFGNVVDNPYKPDNISESHTAIAKNAASLAISKPDEVTVMTDFQ